jgi:hypothetical protein
MFKSSIKNSIVQFYKNLGDLTLDKLENLDIESLKNDILESQELLCSFNDTLNKLEKIKFIANKIGENNPENIVDKKDKTESDSEEESQEESDD